MKLAGVRQKAAVTTLEAQLEEKLDNNKIIDMDLVYDDKEPQTEVSSTYFITTKFLLHTLKIL